MLKIRAATRRIIEVFTRRDCEYSECQQALFSVVWGICFAVEDAWILGLLFVLIGVARILGVGTINYNLRRGASFVGSLSWLYAFMLLGQDGRVIPSATAFLLMGFSAWSYWRMRGRRDETAWRRYRAEVTSR